MSSRQGQRASTISRWLGFEPLESRCLLAGLSQLSGEPPAGSSEVPAAMDCHVLGLSQVEFQPRVTDLQGQPIEQVRVGDSFMLQIRVRDLREAPEGVFAAFADLLYDENLLQVDGELEFSELYSIARHGTADLPGLLDEVGAASGSLAPIGGGDFLLVSLVMRATEAGSVTLRTDPADESIVHEVLLYGIDDPIPDRLIHYGQLTLTVLGPGESPIESGNGKLGPAGDAAALAGHAVAAPEAGEVNEDANAFCSLSAPPGTQPEPTAPPENAFVSTGDKPTAPPEDAFVSTGDEPTAPPLDEAFVPTGDEPTAPPPDEAFVPTGDEPTAPPPDEAFVPTGDEPTASAGDEPVDTPQDPELAVLGSSENSRPGRGTAVKPPSEAEPDSPAVASVPEPLAAWLAALGLRIGKIVVIRPKDHLLNPPNAVDPFVHWKTYQPDQLLAPPTTDLHRFEWWFAPAATPLRREPLLGEPLRAESLRPEPLRPEPQVAAIDTLAVDRAWRELSEELAPEPVFGPFAEGRLDVQ